MLKLKNGRLGTRSYFRNDNPIGLANLDCKDDMAIVKDLVISQDAKVNLIFEKGYLGDKKTILSLVKLLSLFKQYDKDITVNGVKVSNEISLTDILKVNLAEYKFWTNFVISLKPTSLDVTINSYDNTVNEAAIDIVFVDNNTFEEYIDHVEPMVGSFNIDYLLNDMFDNLDDEYEDDDEDLYNDNNDERLDDDLKDLMDVFHRISYLDLF